MNWPQLAADLCWFYHWPPDAAWSMTGRQMSWWCDQANRIIERSRMPATE